MPQKKYLLKAGFIVQEVPDGMVIFDADQSKLYSFNETGSFIFSQIKAQKSEAVIINMLTEIYAVSPERALREVREFLDRLRELKILE